MERYGHFSEDGMEFIITRPDTPGPWVNYLSNGRYSGLLSHTGGGFSFYRSPKDSRITRWRYNGLPVDRPGRYIYLRDAESGDYWSPTWQPTATDLDDFECRHGLYYSRISSRHAGIHASVLYFVPMNDDLEIWEVTLRNESDRERRFDVFAFAELALGHALVDLINQPNDQHFNDVRFERDGELLMASKRYWVTYSGPTVKQANKAWDRWVWFASDLPVKGFDGSKDTFIGRWRSESNPIAVAEGRCRDTEITAGDAVAALQGEVVLAPGETRTFAFLMGVVERSGYVGAARPVADRYRDGDTRAAAFAALREHWRDYLTCVHVETPDPDMNTMLNVWNQYQTSVTFRFSRDASYHHGGLLFGRGYRDSCQDIMGPVMARPEWVAERLREMSTFQFKDGSTYHLYYPLTGGGERTGHTDTPLWLPLAVCVYLKETGHMDFLKEVHPYADGGQATLLEHLYGAIDYTIANLTDRNLARIYAGDWNDTLDYLGREGRGESVWVSMCLCYVLRLTIELCDHLGETERAARYRADFERVANAINAHCWDGQWYIRATNDLGEIIGSSKNEEGRIFLNTQSWAVMSGVATGERARQCMDAVREHLDTPKGPKILHPAYTRVDPNIGLATRCVPGKKENGAVFNHPVSWAILAECLLGRGERAYEIYRKALPMNPVVNIDRYQVEPYVYAEYVTSPDHPTMGQASHSWLTGSSTWMLRDGIDYILGVRPTYRGLEIDPCIPADWDGYRISRRFRGVTYDITVANPDHRNGGTVTVVVEGQAIEGNCIDLTDPEIAGRIAGKDRVLVTARIGA